MNVYEKVQAWHSPGFRQDENKRIGKVKIIEYEGEHYFRAQVVEGTMGTGDVVKLKPGPGPAAMVIPPPSK